MSDRDPVVNLRVPQAIYEELEKQAEATDRTRSEIARSYLELGIETASNGGGTEEIDNKIEDIIERNKSVKELLPSDWRSFCEDRFAESIRKDYSPEDIRHLGNLLREQAQAKEEKARQIPAAPEADLVGVVDDVLVESLQAEGLTNYYEDVDNRFEARFEGVREGREEREQFVRVVQSTVRSHQELARALSDDATPTVRPDSLPPNADNMLPDGIDPEEVAELADRLVEQDVDAEDVPDAIPTTDPSLEAVEIGSQSVEPADENDSDEAILVMGGQKVNGRFSEQTEESSDQTPEIDAQIEKTQQEARNAIPAPNGDSTEAEGCGNMNPTTHDDNPDESTDLELPDESEEVQEENHV